MGSEVFAKRIDKVLNAMRAADLDAMLLSTPESMGYLHGFFEDAHERLMLLMLRSNGDLALICPSLSEAQAKRAGIGDVRSWNDSQSPMELFRKAASDWDFRTAVIGVDDSMRADHLLLIQDVLPAALFRSASPALSTAMRNKDAAEKKCLREAGALADAVFADLPNAIRPGMTERQIQGWIQGEILRQGGALNFCIVGIDAGSAEPHHLNGDTELQPGSILLVDFGCIIDHYHADITRMLSVGKPSEEAAHVYSIVLKAHTDALNSVHPGVTAGSVDEAARAVIENAGFGELFTHRTGHGIGMRGHEIPNIAPGSQVGLEVGDAFSIEPGIYMEGKFGVRLENIVVCGEQGAELMNSPIPTEFTVI